MRCTLERFIHRWFSSEEDKRAGTAQKYWNLLQQDENKAAKELAQTPLLLMFLCLVYDRQQTLANVRSTLYDKALDILLSEWAAQKRLEQDPIYEGFNPGLEKLLLAEIAHDSFVQDHLFFSKGDIINRITEFLADTLDAPKTLDGSAVLTAIENQQGILVERASNAYSFSHLTLQEYLAALYIVRNQLVDDLVIRHLTDERWREVFLLVAGLMENQVHQLLNAIDQQSRTYITQHPKVCNLINWANVVTDTSSAKYKAIAKRATAIAIASAFASDRAIDSASALALAIDIDRASDRTRAIASAIASARDIAIASDRDIAIASAIALAIDIDRAIARAIASDIDIDRASNSDIARAIASIYTLIDDQFFTPEKFNQLPAQLSHLKQSILGENDSEQWRQWADQLESAWLEALNLDKEALTFSETEAKALHDYLYANELMIRCKESAIRVSRKAWEDLEARLLTLG